MLVAPEHTMADVVLRTEHAAPLARRALRQVNARRIAVRVEAFLCGTT
jgi:hypothetical protein